MTTPVKLIYAIDAHGYISKPWDGTHATGGAVLCAAYNNEQAVELWQKYQAKVLQPRKYVFAGTEYAMLFDDAHQPEPWQVKATQAQDREDAAKLRYVDRQ